MSTALTDKRLNAVFGRAAAVFAAGLIAALIGAGSATAQVAPPTETTPTTPAAPSFSQVFPLPGSHYYGQGFGAARGKRGHQGHDIFAACGEPLVAVSNAQVVFKGTHPAAGNYVVIRSKKLKQDYMYAHLAYPAAVANPRKLRAGKAGKPTPVNVTVGQQIGYVGDTGNASGCHLHFELWMGKWYRGGQAIDPYQTLLNWDAYS